MAAALRFLRETDDVTGRPVELNPLCVPAAVQYFLPACRRPQITVLKEEEGIIFQSEAAMRLIPS